MKITLNVWRQQNAQSSGRFETYVANNVSEHMSFLEMLDVVNTDLVKAGKEPIAFDHDCREGICGSCGIVIGGRAHGPGKGIATCQLHMRSCKPGAMCR
jgi:succinate dehydrogenase / fumarate reductase iron-sulfur subunit